MLKSIQKASLVQFLGTAFSIGLAFATAATAIGSLVGGYLIDTLGYSKVFTLFLILATISLILRFFLEETLEKPTGTITFKNPLTILKQFGKLKSVRYLPHIAAYVSLIGIVSGMNIYIWIFMKDILKMSAFLIGLGFGITQLISAFLQLSVGRFIDRYGPTRSLVMMHIIEIPAVIAFAHAPNPWYAILFIVILGVAATFHYAGYPVLITRITTEDVKATTYGVLDAVMKLAAIPGPILGAVLWSLSPKLLFYTIALLAIPAITILAILDRKLRTP